MQRDGATRGGIDDAHHSWLLSWPERPLLAATSARRHSRPPAKPCSGPEYRTLDFWVGDWVAQDEKGEAIGTNRITRDEYGDCVITEHFRIGRRLADRPFGVDLPPRPEAMAAELGSTDQNGYFDLVGGPVSGSATTSSCSRTSARPKRSRIQRMIWQDVKPDSFTWRWQSRGQGRPAAGPTAGSSSTSARRAEARAAPRFERWARASRRGALSRSKRKSIDHAHARRVADALVGQQPQLAPVAGSRRDAADEVRVGVGDDAGQHRDPEPRADRRRAARSRSRGASRPGPRGPSRCSHSW